MRTLAVIPARLGATRLPRKPLRLLAGVPIIVRVMERVAALRVAERVVVATDSQDIADAVHDAGGEAILTRDDHLSGTDRVAEVALAPEFRDYDAILNVQGDEPFVSGAAVRGALEQVLVRGFPLGTAAAPSTRSALQAPDIVKVVTADDGAAMYFSRAPIPWLREAADADVLADNCWHHVGVYVYTPDALAHWIALPPHPLEVIERLEQLRPLAAGLRMGVALTADAPRGGIDTESDLERAQALWPSFTITDS